MLFIYSMELFFIIIMTKKEKNIFKIHVMLANNWI
mgnify:CR=1 FL=1